MTCINVSVSTDAGTEVLRDWTTAGSWHPAAQQLSPVGPRCQTQAMLVASTLQLHATRRFQLLGLNLDRICWLQWAVVCFWANYSSMTRIIKAQITCLDPWDHPPALAPETTHLSGPWDHPLSSVISIRSMQAQVPRGQKGGRKGHLVSRNSLQWLHSSVSPWSLQAQMVLHQAELLSPHHFTTGLRAEPWTRNGRCGVGAVKVFMKCIFLV